MNAKQPPKVQSNWHPSPQFISQVAGITGSDQNKTQQAINQIGETCARMNLDITKIPEPQLLLMVKQINQKVSGNQVNTTQSGMNNG